MGEKEYIDKLEEIKSRVENNKREKQIQAEAKRGKKKEAVINLALFG